MKKLFSIVATVMLLAGIVIPANTSAAYSDELTGAYSYAYGMGITTQSSIENADMYGSLTRIALAKMISNYVLELGLQTPDTSKECIFTDVSNALDTQYNNGVKNACQLGLMGVGISTFRPNDTVTRAEFGTVLSRAIWGDDNNGSDPYYVAHLNALKDAEVMTNIANPNMKEVRGYVMLMMQRADESGVANNQPAICSTPENVLACSLGLDSCPAECLETEEEVDLPGFATISRVGSTATQYVASNAVNKKVGAIKLTAGQNDTTVSSVVVSHNGLGDSTDVTVQLYKDGVVASNARAITSSSQNATLRFTPALELKAGSSMTFDVMASVDGLVNEEHNFSVTAVNVVNGTATGTPIALDTLRTTSYVVGNANPTLTTYSVKAGDVQELVASVSILPGKNAIIKGVTLTRSSGKNIDEVLSNVKAYYNDEIVGTVTVTDEKIVVAGLNIERLNGETANIELKANGIYIGTLGDVLLVVEANDVYAVEANTNESMRSLASAIGTLSVANVDMSLTKVSTGSQTVAPGTSNVELLNLKLTSNTEFEVSNYTIKFNDIGELLTNFIDNEVTVYINGIDYSMTTDTLTLSASSDRFFIDKNNPATIRVVGHTKSVPAVLGESYQMNFAITEVKNIENGNTIGALTYNKNGDTTTVNVGSYTVTKPSTLPNNKTVMEGSDSDLVYFNMKAAAENQVLKAVTVTSALGGNFDVYATELTLMQGNSIVKTIDEADLGVATVTFNDFSRNLTKDASVPFTIRATLKDGDVTTLGDIIQLQVTDFDVRRAAAIGDAELVTTSVFNTYGKAYQIASNIPTIALTAQVEKNTTVQFANTSSYDIRVTNVTFDMTRNLNNGSYVTWDGTAALLDGINGTAVSVTAPVIPGPAAFVMNAGYIVSTSTVDANLELVDSANTVTDADYTVTAKSMTFVYVDRDTSVESAPITETYSISK
ncbi:hypothetical protein P148_SR1C00001G1039 [candidate division SR1 bacterium RAAC1_SR1_1]|nr:hypothetical protein P148_SR1C00001G1039 [candidate division SR1 bacterium RAAC1_SR1_1]